MISYYIKVIVLIIMSSLIGVMAEETTFLVAIYGILDEYFNDFHMFDTEMLMYCGLRWLVFLDLTLPLVMAAV